MLKSWHDEKKKRGEKTHPFDSSSVDGCSGFFLYHSSQFTNHSTIVESVKEIVASHVIGVCKKITK